MTTGRINQVATRVRIAARGVSTTSAAAFFPSLAYPHLLLGAALSLHPQQGPTRQDQVYMAVPTCPTGFSPISYSLTLLNPRTHCRNHARQLSAGGPLRCLLGWEVGAGWLASTRQFLSKTHHCVARWLASTRQFLSKTHHCVARSVTRAQYPARLA